jgi:colanic acid biosynthesis glycosyl transferase WcaI
MARILILSLVFAPDGVSTAQLMSEVAADLHRAGHSVSVVTTQPHYNRDLVAEAAQPLARHWGGLLFKSDFVGVPVIHTFMPRKRGSFLIRLPGWVLFHVLALGVGLFLVERPDVVMVPSPLLTAGVLGWVVARLRRARFVYNVLELYPDLAVKIGQLRNRPVIALLRALEGFVYRHAAVVTVIAEGMRRAVVAKHVSSERVRFIPNFVDVDQLRPGPKDNAFGREHGLGGAFVVSYAGNLGFAQGLEVLLEAAALLADERDVRFLFVGDGVLRERLVEEARARSLGNVRFVAHQPYARVPEIYAASDLCVVALVGALDAEAVPSKFLRIMACGRPVLAMADAGSELAQEVAASEAGVVVAPSSAAAVADVVRALKGAPARCAAMGAAGRAYVSTRYARTVVTGKYSALADELAGRGDGAGPRGESGE